MKDTFRVFVEYLIERQHADYLRTGNPIYAWRAMQIARVEKTRGGHSAAVPEWVMEYLDACAVAVQKAANPESVAAALGMFEKHKHSNPRKKGLLHARDERIVETVLAARDARDFAAQHGQTRKERQIGSQTDMDIFDTVAAGAGLSSERVQSICYKAHQDGRRIIAKLSSS